MMNWLKYLLAALMSALALAIAYVVIDHTGADQYISEDARVTQTGHMEAWTEHRDQHFPIDDHGGEMVIPQTIDHPESSTFEIQTGYGPISVSFNQPEAAKLLCCRFVKIKYRLGRLSHSPIDLSIGAEDVHTSTR